jgi:hypothetical protein
MVARGIGGANVWVKEAPMGILRHKRSTDFICDICGNLRVVEHGSTWDESRSAASMAQQDGWRVGKGRQVLCPTCNADTGYSLDDVLRG